MKQNEANPPAEIPDHTFTSRELTLHNGDDHPTIYIAYQGIVYDVTDCPRWRSGLHERIHFPAQDLTGEIEDAPHAEDVFSRPCVKIVGRLAKADHAQSERGKAP